jgi:ribulose-bisphosphate carboxylase large chain
MGNATHVTIVYQLAADSRSQAEQIAENISIEQSVEMPAGTVPASASASLPSIEKVDPIDENLWKAVIHYPVSIIDSDPTQFLNVLYGNISLLDGIKLLDVHDQYFAELLSGPAFGIPGIRKLLNVHTRPLSCTALKPVGLSAVELAGRAGQFARGGIDIIKDDHGLADQSTAAFTERVSSCLKAIRDGEQRSGKRTCYFPNITTSPARLFSRFQQAVDLGAEGVLISPQLTGIEAMHEIAKTAQVPVMAHPAFSGPYVIPKRTGFSMELYYGKLWRAFGADAIIYPNAGGRFTFSKATCQALNLQMRKDFCTFKPSFPVPAGGIDLVSIPDWIKEYGKETIFLVGGSLYKQDTGIEQATATFQQMLGPDE